MNRREFGFFGGAGILSTLLPRPAFRPAVDLAPFADRFGCSTRYDLSKPFRQLAMTYATDGRICIRTRDVMYRDLAGEDVTLPDCSPLRFPSADPLDRSGWRPLSSATRVAWEKAHCPNCEGIGGTGNVASCRECARAEHLRWESCDRELTEEEHDQYDELCDHELHCNGWQFDYECDYCDGKGTCDYAYRLGAVTFGPQYHRKIANLPNPEIRVMSAKDLGLPYDESYAILGFRCLGASGLLMPMVDV